MTGRPRLYDRDALHQTLWERSDRRHVFSGNLKALSLETGMSYFHLTRMMKTFMEEGRLRLLSRGAHRLQIFLVTEPEGEQEPERAKRAPATEELVEDDSS